MNKTEIMNTYAIEQGYEDWRELTEDYAVNGNILTCKYLDHQTAVTDLIQEELLKKVSHKAKILVEGVLTEERKILFTLFDKGVKGIVRRKVTVDKESILKTEIL